MDTTFGIVLFNGFEDLDFFGPWEMLAVWSRDHGGPTLLLISEKKQSVISTKGLTIQTQYSFSDCPPLDYLLVPGGMGTRTEVNNRELIAFIKQQATHCQHILSVCTGAFLLQAADLLENKTVTTHWASIERLKAFTGLTVVQERFVRDGNIWSSSGVSAGIDLALAFIATVGGENIAGKVQHFTEYYPSSFLYPIEGKYPVYVK